jgi:hypothetical protein
LRREAKGETASKIDQVVATRLRSAETVTGVEPLQRFYEGFGDQPAATTARDELIRRLNAAGRRLDAELTGVKPLSVPESNASTFGDWPLGKVEATTATTKDAARLGYGRSVLNLDGDPGPYFRDLSLQFDYNRRTIVAYNSVGKEQWKVSLAENGQQNYSYNPSMTHGCTNGHLLVVSLGWKLIAIDTLGLGANGTPRVVWTQDLLGQTFDFSNASLPPQLANMNWQLQHMFSQVHDQSKLLGPVCRDYASFQRFHSLMVVDPRNGETLWARQNVPSNSDLFGDDEFVFVLPPESDEAKVFRASDGELVGTRKVPRVVGRQVLPSGEQRAIYGRFDESCLATLGRNLLLWWPDGNQRVLTLVDPLEGRDLWRGRKFAAGAHACVVDDKVVGVMEPGGRFVLVSLPDGRTIADLKLEAEPLLTELTLLASGGQYFVLTRTSQGENNAPGFQPMPGCVFKPIYRGRLYAIDRQGKLQWPASVVIKNQFLMSNQPAGLPVLTFASQVYEQRANGQSRYKASILCVDKRNGRVAYKKTFNNMTGVFSISGDAAKRTIDLTMQQNTVTLTFTDKPITPPAAKKTPAKMSPGEKTIRGLWDSIQKLVGPRDEDADSDDQ